MKITKLSPEVKEIFNKMGERRAQLDTLICKFAEVDATDVDAILEIQAKVKQILPKTAA